MKGILARSALPLAAAGLALSEYLFARAMALSAPASVGPDFCATVLGSDCDRVLGGEMPHVLGLPLAGWGVVHFGAITLLLVLGWAHEAARSAARAGALFLALLGALVGLVLVALFAVGRWPPCPLCLAVHGVSLALVPACWGPVRVARPRASALSGLLVWALLVGGLAGWVARAWHAGGGLDPATVLEAYHREAVVSIPIREDDARLGLPDAPVRLVVFSDFECPACRDVLPALSELARRHPRELAVHFKHYPLSVQCNPAVRRDLHPGACRAALAAEAARQQRAFWPYHDRLVEVRSTLTPERLAAVAQDLRLDLGAFDAALGEARTRARVEADVALGWTLGVDGTPAVFLDGRRVRDLRPAVLALLVASRRASARVQSR